MDKEKETLTKDSMLADMTKNYLRQRAICDEKWELAMQAEQNGSTDLSINKKTKKENTELKEYNQQVKALGDTARSILSIQKSDMPKDDEENEISDDLV